MSVIRIPAQITDYDLVPERSALLIIDVQNDWCSPGGYAEALGYDLGETRRPIPVIQAVRAAVRPLGVRVLYTREGYRPDLSDCPPSKVRRAAAGPVPVGAPGPRGRYLIRGTWNNEVIDELKPEPEDIIIDKPGIGSFHGTHLQAILTYGGIDTLLITGVNTDFCVSTTIREANDRGFECVMIEDACGSVNPPGHAAAVRLMRESAGRPINVFGWVTTSARLLAALAAAR